MSDVLETPKVVWRITFQSGGHVLIRSQAHAIDGPWLVFYNDPEAHADEDQYAQPGIVARVPFHQVAYVKDNARGWIRP